jgi:hypothetical protein
MTIDINKRYILTKWCHVNNGMADFVVKVTSIFDGPNGDFVAIEGVRDREIVMPLEHFRQHAREITPIKYPWLYSQHCQDQEECA